MEAAKRLSNERKDILIPAAVLVEFLNMLGRKAGHSAALAAVTELTPPFLVISEPDNLLDTPALEKFSTVPQGVSFTDCLVMALADEYGTRDIFGFEKQFEEAEYRRFDPSTNWKDKPYPPGKIYLRNVIKNYPHKGGRHEPPSTPPPR